MKLLSDLLVSDGTGYNSLIQQDVCYDEWGLPFIPAKRLKGCLRESALELNDWGKEIAIHHLFGESGDTPGCLSISNAVLYNYKAYWEDLKQMDARFTHPQTVLNQFTYLRRQTAIDSEKGIAVGGLRSSRVVKAGCEFVFEVVLLGTKDDIEKDRNDLELCCQALHHMGCNRTRGLGEVEVSFLSEETQNEAEEVEILMPSLEAQAVYRLPYQITLHSPLIVKSANGGQENTLDYIPGAMILGMIAGWEDEYKQSGYLELKELGEIKCANAYIAEKGVRMLPISAALFVVKNQEEQAQDLTCLEERKVSLQDPIIQLKNPGMCYIDGNRSFQSEKIHYQMKKVACEMNYHHSRPKNKAIGKAWIGDENSQFYQMNSISAGQTFAGYVEASGAQIERIYVDMKRHPHFRMGFNHSAEYGEVTLKVSEPQILTATASCFCSQFVVKLESPLMEYDEQGRYTTDIAVLTDELEQVLAKGTKLNVKRSFYRYRMESGFQRKWHLRKPMIDLWDKGTTIIYEVADGSQVDIQLFQNLWLGERVQEGYGEISVYPVSQRREKTLTQIENFKEKEQEKTTTIAYQTELYPEILKNFAKLFLEQQAREDARKDWDKDMDLALIQYLISSCRTYFESNEEKPGLVIYLKKEMEERYNKKSNDKKRGKYDLGTKILACYDENRFNQAFEKIYGCTWDAIQDSDFFARSYYMAYLTEMKYLGRSMKVGESCEKRT